jgi:hypothetical protein
MTKRDPVKADFLQRAEEARMAAAKAADPKAKLELMRLSEMWERLARDRRETGGAED